MIIKEIKNRRSVRDYKSDDVPEEYIIEMIKAGQLAPTASNNRATEFIVVKDKKTKKDIFEITGQDFVKEAPVLIVPAIDENETTCPVQDLSVASENMFLQAISLGLGTVWKNLKTEEIQVKVKKILNIPRQYRVINVIPVGFSVEKLSARDDDRFDIKKIHKEKW